MTMSQPVAQARDTTMETILPALAKWSTQKENAGVSGRRWTGDAIPGGVP